MLATSLKFVFPVKVMSIIRNSQQWLRPKYFCNDFKNHSKMSNLVNEWRKQGYLQTILNFKALTTNMLNCFTSFNQRRCLYLSFADVLKQNKGVISMSTNLVFLSRTSQSPPPFCYRSISSSIGILPREVISGAFSNLLRSRRYHQLPHPPLELREKRLRWLSITSEKSGILPLTFSLALRLASWKRSLVDLVWRRSWKINAFSFPFVRRHFSKRGVRRVSISITSSAIRKKQQLQKLELPNG